MALVKGLVFWRDKIILPTSSAARKEIKQEKISHNRLDNIMTFPNLGVPAQAQFPALDSPQRVTPTSTGGRKKVQLDPGHSLMDWIRLGKSGQDLTGLGGRRMEVTQEELAKHNKPGDVWLALRGNVYNVTAYQDFHPGGVDELLRGTGQDGTSLFDEVHKWVNAESMLEKCFVGKLKQERTLRKDMLRKRMSNGALSTMFPPPSPTEPQPPKFDWIQAGNTVSIVVYTKWSGMTQEFVIIDKEQKCLLLTFHLKDFVFYINVDLVHDVTDTYNVSVNGVGKVEVMLQKATPDVQWPTLGRFLDRHNEYIRSQKYNPAYRDCTIEQVTCVTNDSNLYCLRLPPGTRMSIPLGCHVFVKTPVSEMKIVRSYTAVIPSLRPDSQDSRVLEGTALYLLIKIYPGGVVTPVIAQLQPGYSITVSSFVGVFELPRFQQCSHLVMFCAGTGFTPMVRLIYQAVVQDTSVKRVVKLMFFNKTREDILWKDELSALAEQHDNFTFENCLSEPNDDWTGLTGRVTRKMIQTFLPPMDHDSRLLLCTCGPPPFTEIVTKFADEEGYSDNIHAFNG